MTFRMLATASAAPSINPSETALAPSTEVRKNGSSGYTDSVAVSFKRLTPPRIHTPLGSENQRAGRDCSLSLIGGERTIDRPKRKMATLSDALAERTLEGDLYDRLDAKWVHCYACGHNCKIPPGALGVCKVRFNSDGRLIVPWG